MMKASSNLIIDIRPDGQRFEIEILPLMSIVSVPRVSALTLLQASLF